MAILLVLMLLDVTLVLSACSQEGSSSIPDAPIDVGALHVPAITGENVVGNELVSMDISSTDEGYVAIKYMGSNGKVKLQIKSGDNTYTYDVSNPGDYMVFPFSCGSETYRLEVYENITGDEYALACAQSVDVKLNDETSPYLYPNTYVNYDADSTVVDLAYQVTADSQSQLDLVEDVYKYVIDNIDYDYDKAKSVETGYIPDLDSIIEAKSGICFDFASLMSAMLRIRNIPTRLVVGYSGDVYHAWVDVYISDVGWVNNVIEFDGTDWTLMDPTYAASSQTGSEGDYVNHQDQYHALYFY